MNTGDCLAETESESGTISSGGEEFDRPPLSVDDFKWYKIAVPAPPTNTQPHIDAPKHPGRGRGRGRRSNKGRSPKSSLPKIPYPLFQPAKVEKPEPSRRRATKAHSKIHQPAFVETLQHALQDARIALEQPPVAASGTATTEKQNPRPRRSERIAAKKAKLAQTLDLKSNQESKVANRSLAPRRLSANDQKARRTSKSSTSKASIRRKGKK